MKEIHKITPSIERLNKKNTERIVVICLIYFDSEIVEGILIV